MTIIGLLILLLIAAVCGSIGASLAGGGGKGCIANIVLGFIGALIGGWLSRSLHIRDLLTLQGIPIVWSIIGSAVFVAIIQLLSGSGKKKSS